MSIGAPQSADRKELLSLDLFHFATAVGSYLVAASLQAKGNPNFTPADIQQRFEFVLKKAREVISKESGKIDLKDLSVAVLDSLRKTWNDGIQSKYDEHGHDNKEVMRNAVQEQYSNLFNAVSALFRTQQVTTETVDKIVYSTQDDIARDLHEFDFL